MPYTYIHMHSICVCTSQHMRMHITYTQLAYIFQHRTYSYTHAIYIRMPYIFTLHHIHMDMSTYCIHNTYIMHILMPYTHVMHHTHADTHATLNTHATQHTHASCTYECERRSEREDRRSAGGSQRDTPHHNVAITQ